MYGQKNRPVSSVDYCLMPVELLSPVSSPPPIHHSLQLPAPPNPPVDWILKKERIFLLAQFWQQRATLAEKEVTSLKEQLVSRSTSGAMAPPPDRDDHIITNSHHSTQAFELAAKDKEIASLMEDVQNLQSSLNQIRESSATQIRLLEEQLDHKQEMISRLEARLDSQRDYEELKRSLLILKASTKGDTTANVNGMDAKDSKDKQSMSSRFMMGNNSLPVEAFGSLLGEELVATWRRSLERSLLTSSPPTQLQANTVQHNLVNDSSLTPPQQCSPGNSSLNDSNQNFDNSSLLNGSSSGMHERLPFRFEDSLIPKSDPMEAKLQEMLRYNMDKFGSQCLDTLQISRRVRELLSIHNIGQRLFAKYVLGLSQGTVSELLSKPKPWDKLTEKGRDSYRKMHAWAADDASVLLLKSLIPKKGKEGGNVSSSARCEESGAEDRIAHILSEANHALHRNSLGNQSGAFESTADDNVGCKSPNNGCGNDAQGPVSPSSSSSRDRRLRKYEHDDISQEQVARIYQEELAKLVGLRLPGVPDGELRLPREQFQSLLFPNLFGGSMMERDDIRMALDAYHRELAKLTESNSPTPPHFPSVLFHPAPLNTNGPGGVQDLSMPKRFSPEVKDNDEKVEKDDSPEVLRHIGSAFSLVRPKTSEGSSGAPSPLNSILQPAGTDDSSNASPLQRMASITNSLISQPTTPSVSSPHQRPLKAVLPPITQQQFDQYNNLNTEDIVRKVKEQLSQYSISQRLFGESVLGLSQGSVSDLLARPKPWHMLTQKGREPFIRMKMFLEDDNAVHKLVASQYKIAPEKLMRTGGYAGNSYDFDVIAAPATVAKSQPKPTEIPKSSENSPLPPAMTLTSPTHISMPPTPEIVKKTSPPQGVTVGGPVSNSRLQQVCVPQQPSVYEMAALTQDLDTLLITTKIKEALLANNIGQKIFGEVVLGLSQGSVSELLSKPKPWHMLSIKGREPFIRMQLWLADSLNVERLQHLKNERREANKRKRGINNHASPIDVFSSGGNQASSENSNDSPNESYSPGSVAGANPNKKQRVLFTDEQKEALRLAFALDSYPNLSAIEFLGRELGLSSRTITNWFHNHRMRLKQQTSSPVVQDCSMSSQTLDPVQFRVLLHQRLLEIRKDKYSSRPLSGRNNSLYGVDEGLDLTIAASRNHSDNEDDYFDEDFDDNEYTGSDETVESMTSGSAVKRKSAPSSISRNMQDASIGACTLGSSRRKPVAPQWLNPSWHDDSDDEEVLINGVCVLQNPLNYGKCNSKDTMRLEPSSPREFHKSIKVEKSDSSSIVDSDETVHQKDKVLRNICIDNSDEKLSIKCKEAPEETGVGAVRMKEEQILGYSPENENSD